MANTSLIGLSLPVQGTLSGQWGDTVNNAISQIVDVAVAGTQTISTDADITLTLTTGTYASTGLTANSSQYAVLLWTAGGTATRTITVPAQSKTYVVINKTSSTQSIIIQGTTGTGVTVPAGTRAIVAWDGVNFVNVGGGSAAGSNTQLQFNSSGVFGASANLTWDGSNLQVGSQGDVRFGDSDNSNYIALQGPSTVASNVTFTLPSADGTNGQVMTTNGSGALSFATVASPAKASGALIVNTTTVSENYTVPSGSNAFSVGPITVSSGYAVTVSSGQRWVVI
jgi:hypothetical protein